MAYADDQMLMLSGIQHFMFCPRQWALIHIEQEWSDNQLTIEGQLLHKHVDDPSYRQKCGDHITLRSVSLASKELGLYGISDAIELHPVQSQTNCFIHPKYPGNWLPIIVEYKHGKPKHNAIDEVQLAAQVMCLEEMYNLQLSHASFFYAEIRRRVDVDINDALRQIVHDCAKEMHEIYQNATIPQAQYSKKCIHCSLQDVCMPQIGKCTKVEYYLTKHLLNEETT